MDEITNASFEGKTKVVIPEGAKIVKKDVSVRVKEIENGFIISKSFDIKWSKTSDDGDINTGYEYYTKEWYAEENPIKIDDSYEEELSLADKFE